VNHLALFLVILAGALLGMLPYMAFLGSPMFTAIYVGGSLLVAFTLAVRHVPAKNEPPRLAEHLYAVLGGAAFSASWALMAFTLYGLAYGLTYPLGYIGGWLQLGWHANPGSVAFWASGPITLLLSLALLSFSRIPRTLYPDAAGVVSAYDSLLQSGILKWAIPIVLGGTALSILTYFFWPSHWWWYIAAIYSIIGAGRNSLSVVTEWSPTVAVDREAVQAIQKLYDILGYRTVVSPRMKDPNEGVDSLLKWVDILASREQEALAIGVKTPVRSRAVSADDGSILPIAARVMSRNLGQQVQPVLVLVGREPTADLVHLAEDERIKVLSLTEDAIREVLKNDDETVLRQLAQRYLLTGPAAISAQSSSSTSASVAS
jgi:hypothetical protein